MHITIEIFVQLILTGLLAYWIVRTNYKRFTKLENDINIIRINDRTNRDGTHERMDAGVLSNRKEITEVMHNLNGRCDVIFTRSEKTVADMHTYNKETNSRIDRIKTDISIITRRMEKDTE